MNKSETVFEKVTNKDKKEKSSSNKVVGSGAVVGGGLLAKKQFTSGNLTGRETVYHYTDNKNVPSILREGLKGSKTNQPGTVVKDVLGGHLSDKELANKIYLAKKKSVAKGVGAGKKLRGAETPSTILKGNVPLWKHKLVDNPELMGAKTKQEFVKKLVSKKPILELTPGGKLMAAMSYKGLSNKGTAVVEGDVSSKYLKESPNYAKNSVKEIKSFIKANPKRFTKGTLLTGAGLGIAALGASMFKGDKSIEKSAANKFTKAVEFMSGRTNKKARRLIELNKNVIKNTKDQKKIELLSKRNRKLHHIAADSVIFR